MITLSSERLKSWFLEPRECDRPLRPVRRLAWLAAGVVALLLAELLSHFPSFVETVYTEHIGQWAGRALAALTRWYPWSFMEIVLAVLALWLLVSASKSLYHVIRGRRRLLNALGCGVLRASALVGFILVSFYTIWGFNYDRADLITRLGWQQWAKAPDADAGTAELEKVCRELVAVDNREYKRAFGTDDLGRASTLPMPVSELDRDIDAAYLRVAERLHLAPSFAASRGPAKPVLASFVMSAQLISGEYTPWTGEANYNRNIPPCNIPEVIGHEKAHQRGVTSEDEANFFGFLVCASSDNPYARYSAYLMAQRQLVGELGKRDAELAKAVANERCPGSKRDLEAMNAYYHAHVGKVSQMQNKVNDMYLKANRVKGGVQAYGRSAALIMAFARSNGDSCVVPVP